MSIEAMTWVLRHSTAKLGARLVLLALADHAHFDGSEAYPSVETLERHTLMSRRAVQGALRKLEEDGEIVRDGEGRNGTSCWRLVLGGADSARGAENDGQGAQKTTSRGAESAPNPSLTVPEPSERARKPMTYGGQRVRAGIVESAVRLMATFNEATTSALSPQKRDGSPSPHMRQIVGALIDRDGVTEDQWHAAIRETVSDPPSWLEGRPVALGDIFGARAADHALARAQQKHRAASASPNRPRLGTLL